MRDLSIIEQFMVDEEFFSFGAMLADTAQNKVTLAKGGAISSKQLGDKNYFYAKDFYSHHYTFYYPQEIIELPLDEVIHYFKRYKDTPEVSETINYDHLYEKDFNHFKDSLETLEKVVLISREEFRVKNFKATLRHFFYSALNFGTGYPYGYWNETSGILGATPELLFELSDNELFTFALAGTAKIEESEELLKSTKNLHEHNIVVDDIREKLTPYCEDIISGKTYLHPFKHIVHLRTDFKARMYNFDKFLDLTTAMSPTAALGGYPMEQCISFLRKTQYAREFSQRIFGSVMGLVKDQHLTSVVMIRNLQWLHDKFIIECGGGVVEESDLENELGEIHLKRSIIKKNYL